jgi:predicted MFS family arabinose efflux permease
VNTDEKRHFHYGWIILIVAVIVVTGALGFARFGYTMLLPPMKASFGLDDAQAGDLATGNLSGYLVLALFCGLLASRFGPRVVIGISMFIAAAAMLLTGLSDGFLSAFIARTLAGIGGAGANVPIMGLVTAWFVARRRGLATGIAVSGSSFGLLFTGTILPPILRSFPAHGFRYSWFLLAGTTFVFTVICIVFLRNSPHNMNLEPVGAEKTPPDRTADRSSSLDWGLIVRTPTVWHLALIYTMFGFSYIIYSTFYVRFLGEEAGFSMEQAGFFWALVGGFSIASGLLWGSVSDRIGRKYGLAIVFAIQAVSFIFFGVWKSPAGALVSSLLFALTAWSIPAIMAATVSDICGPRLAPAALGFITFFFGIGQMAGPFTGGRIALTTGSFTTAFVIAGVAAALGAVGSLFIERHGNR